MQLLRQHALQFHRPIRIEKQGENVEVLRAGSVSARGLRLRLLLGLKFTEILLPQQVSGEAQDERHPIVAAFLDGLGHLLRR